MPPQRMSIRSQRVVFGERPHDGGDATQQSSQADPGEIDSPQRHVLHLQFNRFPRRKNRQAQLQRQR